MKLTDGALVVDNNGEEYIITVGKAAKKFSGMLKLNKTAAFIAHTLQEDVGRDDVINKILEKYDVSREDASKSVDNVIGQLSSLGLLDE